MRARPIVAFVLLLLPASLSAQRIPGTRIPRAGPARPAPLPPQPAPIAAALAYRRSRLAVESYPLISHVSAPDFGGGAGEPGWTSFGTGTRADYRVTRHLSATLDLTSSFIGGPAVTNTAELGTRLRPERTEHRVYPFVDFRVGYITAFSRNAAGLIDDGFGSPPTPDDRGSRYSSGFGGVAGVGMEYALTRRFSLTTAGSVMRSRLTARGFRAEQLGNPSYAMTSYRYMLGIRYNPVRMITPARTGAR